MGKQRISYVDPATIRDEKMLAEFDGCRREGTPRPKRAPAGTAGRCRGIGDT